MSRTYSQLDPAQLGPNLILEDAGRVLTHTVNGDNLSRVARGTVPLSSGVHVFESAIWLPLGGTDTPSWNIGIAKVGHSLSAELGSNTSSMGWKPETGVIRYNAGDLTTGIPVAPVETHVAVVVDLDALLFKAYIDGSLVGQASIPAGQTWYPALSVGGTTGLGLRLLFRAEPPFDALAGAYGAAEGWFSESAAADIIRVGGRGSYISLTTDNEPNTAWRDVIDTKGTWVERSIHFWPWSGEGKRSSYGDLTIKNPPVNADGTGQWDYLVDSDIAGETVELSEVERGSSHDYREILGTPLVDRPYAAEGGNTLVIPLKGTLSRLDTPIPRREMPPWTPSPWAPQPIVIGAARQVPALALDLSDIGENFLLSDRPLSAIAAVREGGDTLTYGFSPDDWTVSLDARGVVLTAPPPNPLTADVSSSGSAIEIPAADDVLDDVGNFSSGDTSGFPDGWQDEAGRVAANGIIETADGLLILGSDDASTAAPAEIRTVALELAAATTYRLTIVIPTAYRLGTGTNHLWWVGIASGAVNGLIFGQSAGTFSTVLTTGAAAYVYIGVHARQYISVDKISAVVLPSYSAVEIDGCTIEAAIADILERTNIAEADWERDDAIALEAIGPFGWHALNETSGTQAIKDILDNITAAPYEDNLGRLRIARLIDPAGGTPVAYITIADLLSVPTPEADTADGLTTTLFARPNWRRLTPAEMVADLGDLPPATRVAFSDPGQFRGAVVAELAKIYAEARRREPKLFLFDNLEDATDELARVLGFYATARKFTVLHLNRRIAGINPGDVVQVDYPRWGLSGGVNVFVYLVGVEVGGNSMRLGVWY